MPTEKLESRTQSNRQVRTLSHLSASLIAVLFSIGLFQFPLESLNGFIADIQFRIKPWGKPHPDIKLIAYDDQASSNYYGSKKIPALEIARVLENLSKEEPLAIGIVADISPQKYSEQELNLISQRLSYFKHAYVGFTDDSTLANIGINPVLRGTEYLPAMISKDSFSYGADNVTRRVMITVNGQQTIYGQLARVYKGKTHFKNAHRYQKLGPMQAFIHWQGPQGTYPAISSSLVSKEQFPQGIFKNKIVLIGNTALKSAEDFVLTAYSRNEHSTTTLEAAAHSLGTLLYDNALKKTPPWISFLLTLVVALCTVNLVLFLNPVKGIFFVVGEVSVLFLLAGLLLHLTDTWIDLAHPFIVSCFGYYLVIPYRLVNEYRRRWHYQSKIEVMSQIEQLKTNFLNLISHDLKTPIARIQGNAELMLPECEAQPTLKKGLQSIVKTSENLTEYVESILDLTRIESSKIPVEFSSRDINSVIKEVIESKAEHAAEKNINLEHELEPMFSLKFDHKLIRRVLANLLENAIKYSPAGSTVTVTSREENEWVKVLIKDQGYGISTEDQERIFMKFYRCEAVGSRQEKGTGLGLYLVKYFTELHRGKIELQSELGKGSIFTLVLPAQS